MALSGAAWIGTWRPENPRVGGSIPSLATRLNPPRQHSLERDGHPVWVAVLPPHPYTAKTAWYKTKVNFA